MNKISSTKKKTIAKTDLKIKIRITLALIIIFAIVSMYISISLQQQTLLKDQIIEELNIQSGFYTRSLIFDMYKTNLLQYQGKLVEGHIISIEDYNRLNFDYFEKSQVSYSAALIRYYLYKDLTVTLNSLQIITGLIIIILTSLQSYFIYKITSE